MTKNWRKDGTRKPIVGRGAVKFKAPKSDGKGNSYVDLVSRHMPLLEAMQTASRKAFKRAFVG